MCICLIPAVTVRSPVASVSLTNPSLMLTRPRGSFLQQRLLPPHPGLTCPVLMPCSSITVAPAVHGHVPVSCWHSVLQWAEASSDAMSRGGKSTETSEGSLWIQVPTEGQIHPGAARAASQQQPVQPGLHTTTTAPPHSLHTGGHGGWCSSQALRRGLGLNVWYPWAVSLVVSSSSCVCGDSPDPQARGGCTVFPH